MTRRRHSLKEEPKPYRHSGHIGPGPEGKEAHEAIFGEEFQDWDEFSV